MMKRFLLIVFTLCLSALVLLGCGKEQAGISKETRTVTYEGENFTIPAKSERIAVLSNSLLQMLYAVDGKAIARPETKDSLPKEMQELPVIGHTATINTESLFSLKPDLILGLKAQHGKLSSVLDGNKLPYILISYDGIHDNIPLLTLLGDITGHQEKAKAVAAAYQASIDKVKADAAQRPPLKVAVLRATGKAVTAETEQAITASMVKELGLTNVVLAHQEAATKAKTIPYSLETLATDNPDVIFVVTMGKREEINAAMAKEMTGNPAWNQLKAVQNHKVFYLPSELFLLNPGLRTPEAMQELLNLAYDKQA